MARAIWKGSISFGLVNIPIALYPATRREELRFRLLRKSDLSPVNYKRVAEKDGKEVPWDQIVKGYEYEKGKLKDTNKVGVAKVVIKTRQYLAGVKPEDGALVLELMHFADELADPEKLHVPKKMEVGKREMSMAKSLIDTMSSKWNPEKYKDDYREALMEVIEEKVEAGGKEIEEKPRKAPKPTKVIDLVSVLQKSLEETGAKKKTTPKSRSKKAYPAKKAA
ncbi:MAG: Ku protein [Verrucomicrobia bacterium]|nr:MAG: Ku protein [Verrucomicrobiota bacterium]